MSLAFMKQENKRNSTNVKETSQKNKTTLERGISVIMCCYNSTSRIKPTLEHLASQKLNPEIECEVIIVDNASADNLKTTVDEIWNKCGNPFPLKIVFEPTSGIAFARRRGVECAKYAYGVFCDDDNWLAPNYLLKVIQILDANPYIGIVGGCSTPVLEVDAPACFYTRCHRLAIGVQAPFTGDVTHRGFLWGAGMGIRLEVLKSIYDAGVEPRSSGRKKDVLTSGDDMELSSWFILARYRLWYDSNLRFQHFIPKERLKDSYFEKFFETPQLGFHNIYGNYILIRYGVFNHPKKNKYFGIFSAFLRLKAFWYIVSRASPLDFIQISKFDRSIKALTNSSFSKS
ncbi:hypothetical protein C8255_04010 [filamentous cyanobacterium CCP3]|nr:hypothetical protein C8255_04010 [filamentous cyanobacterium CCP3]